MYFGAHQKDKDKWLLWRFTTAKVL